MIGCKIAHCRRSRSHAGGNVAGRHITGTRYVCLALRSAEVVKAGSAASASGRSAKDGSIQVAGRISPVTFPSAADKVMTKPASTFHFLPTLADLIGGGASPVCCGRRAFEAVRAEITR
jgi:hypothetical protein